MRFASTSSSGSSWPRPQRGPRRVPLSAETRPPHEGGLWVPLAVALDRQCFGTRGVRTTCDDPSAPEWHGVSLSRRGLARHRRFAGGRLDRLTPNGTYFSNPKRQRGGATATFLCVSLAYASGYWAKVSAIGLTPVALGERTSLGDGQECPSYRGAASVGR